MSTMNPKNNANISEHPEIPLGGLVPVDKPASSDADTRTPEDDRPENFEDLITYLLNTSDYIAEIDKDEELERLRFIVKVRKFYMGHMLGYVSKNSNEWVRVAPKKGKRLFVDPQFQYFVDSNLAQILKSIPKVRITARNPERVDKRWAAKYAQKQWEDFERRQIKFSFRFREAKNHLTCGEAYRHTWFKREVRGTEIRQPRVEKATIKGQHFAWDCPSCMESGELPPEMRATLEMGMGQRDAEKMACPSCSFPKVDIAGARPREIKKLVGYRDVPAGDAVCEGPDPLEMKASNKAYGMEDSLFLTRDRGIMRGTLEEIFEDADIPASTTLPHNVRAQHELQKQSPGAASDGGELSTYSELSEKRAGGEQFTILHFREVWLDRALYSRYRFPKDTPMPNGQVIKRGTRLKELFPNGLYFCHVGRTVLDIRPEDKADTWVHSAYYLGEGFHGHSSMFSLIPLQEQRNELRSLQMSKVMFDSATQTLVRKNAIEGSKLENNPAAVVNVTNFPDDQPLANVMARVQPGREVNEAYQLDNVLANSSQNLAGNSSLMGGAPDMQGSPSRKALTTARGVDATAEQANSRQGPPLGLRAEMIQAQVRQALKARQDNWPEQAYQSLDRQVGGDAGRWFRECDIDRDLIIEIEPGTILPLTESQKREDFAASIQVIAGASQIPDETVRKAIMHRGNELYGSSGFDLDNYQKDTVEAQIRLDRVRSVAATLEQSVGMRNLSVYDGRGEPLPQMVGVVLEQAAGDLKIIREMSPEVFPLVPVQPILDRHKQYIEVYDEWLLSAEGRYASAFERRCVHALIEFHQRAEVVQAQGLGARSIEARLPEYMAQQFVSSQQGEAEAHKDAEAMQFKGQQKERDRQNKRAMQGDKHAHELAMAVNDPSKFNAFDYNPEEEGAANQPAAAG